MVCLACVCPEGEAEPQPLTHCSCQTDFWRPSEALRLFAQRGTQMPCGLLQSAGAPLHLQSF